MDLGQEWQPKLVELYCLTDEKREERSLALNCLFKDKNFQSQAGFTQVNI